VCSAIHPLSLASPFLRTLPLADYGLEWIHPRFPFAHPLDDGTAIIIEHSLHETAKRLGPDGSAYTRLLSPFVAQWQGLIRDLLGPLPFPPHQPILMARFGLHAIRSAAGLARNTFSSMQARAAFAGMAAHSMLPLETPLSGAFALIMGVLAHAVGWPMAREGSQSITQAMAAHLRELGGELITGRWIHSLDSLPESNLVLFDTSPTSVLRIAGDQLREGYRHRLSEYRYGPGVCKVDWALEEQIPWRASEVSGAGAVHLGGTLADIAQSEQAVWRGEHPKRPFVILVQQSQFDPTRAPEGKHTAWAYCHVPSGSNRDVSQQIEAQVEHYAPGFKDCILSRSVHTASQMEDYNPNYVGGDINVGVQDLGQTFTRPAVQWDPYRIPAKGETNQAQLFLCSSATPPGGGVHGMCGYHAAESALKNIR